MTTLTKELRTIDRKVRETHSIDFDILKDFEEHLTEDEALRKSLKTGDDIPYFTLPDTRGRRVNVFDLFKGDYLVIVFYRGQWCPANGAPIVTCN